MNILIFDATVIIKLKKIAVHSVLTITIKVIGLISPTGRFVWVAGGNVAAPAVLCQKVGESEGLPLFFSFLTYKQKKDI